MGGNDQAARRDFADDYRQVIADERTHLAARAGGLGDFAALRDGLGPLAAEGGPLAELFGPDANQAWGGQDSLFGIGLSGGGIRSATFNLGMMQMLAAKGLLRQAHYLSTVSGGGYLGGCVHGLNHAHVHHGGADAQDLLRQSHYQQESVALRHLRAHSHFLAPNGLLDTARMVLQPVVGALVNVAVLVLFLVFLAGFGGWYELRLEALLIALLGAVGLPATLAAHPGGLLALLVFALMAALLLVLQERPLNQRDAWGRRLAASGLAVVFLFLLDRQQDLAHWAIEDEWGRWIYWLAVPFLALVLVWRARADKLMGWTQRIVLLSASAMAALSMLWVYLAMLHVILGGGALPAWMGAAIAWANQPGHAPGVVGALVLSVGLFWVNRRWGQESGWAYLALVPASLLAFPTVFWVVGLTDESLRPALLCLFGSLALSMLTLLVNINMTSPHRFYRDRLSRGFVFRPDGDGVTTPCDDLRLSALVTNKDDAGGKFPALPYALINTTMNVSRGGRDKAKAMAVRSPEFFLFSPLYVGSQLTGYRATAEMEKRDRHLNLPTAMAISGAAASSNMGDTGPAGVRLLMTVLNLRLGYWLPNPAKTGRGRSMDALQNLLLEMSGAMARDSGFVNTSDGGHIENLAAYELIRRQCRLIVLGEAEDDSDAAPGRAGHATLAALARLIRMVRIDLGYYIDFAQADLDGLKGDGTKRAWAVGTIYYPGGRTGKILYLKANLTGTEDHVIADYARTNARFPRESTGDQFFSERQFEAYRSLGYHVAKSALEAATPPYSGER